MLTVKVGPGYYQCEQGVLESLEEKLIERHVKKAYVLHGNRSLEAIKPFLPTFTQIELLYEPYSGHCTDAEVQRHQQAASTFGADCIIGIGGGTAMDLAKACANVIDKEAILLPTLASTCAPWSTLSVIYNELGEYLRYDTFPKGIGMVLIEPEVLAHSPAAYLRAGIGDTLAKWYEADALTRDKTQLRVPVQLALAAAKTCRDTLLEHGVLALDALSQKKVTNDLIQVVETNIAAGGLVGGLGDHYGRIAAAHSIHNGLTIFPETKTRLHGEKVAYGILVQLGLEQNWDEMNKLIPFFQVMGLPMTLRDVGLSAHEHVIEAVAARALAEGESIHFMEESFTSDDLKEVILKIETLLGSGEDVLR
ncbi:iron-containing alcohol dehydrogenase family protein [Alkalicoccobacillus murimartini]|uniref:Oxidoreductase n=1 Tax=Alkalicoccobacillus murimartini TaxID=171685 RepID=A0ABT9YBP6_9BACI|nr:iron-containing alcohol dehydrogenase family protein [Alkalicoccobacillus murimartini]MDQ0205265.1 putative oxidoreductase [Alkalicoccobacillus murimartini]